MVDQTVAERGFTRIPIVPGPNRTPNLLAYYSDYQKISRREPDMASYEVQKLATFVTVMVGDTRETRFDIYVAPGDLRAVATVVVSGEWDLSVLLLGDRLVENLRKQIKDVQFQVKTTSKYSGEF